MFVDQPFLLKNSMIIKIFPDIVQYHADYFTISSIIEITESVFEHSENRRLRKINVIKKMDE